MTSLANAPVLFLYGDTSSNAPSSPVEPLPRSYTIPGDRTYPEGIARQSLYVMAGAPRALAPDPAVVIGMRLVQELPGAAGIVIARAVVRDLYEDLGAARLLSSCCWSPAPRRSSRPCSAPNCCG
ncbi:hypothetical protein ACIRVK_39470 [Streptomyces sp. NPDC101152]|uniref:hypothetical protein n=1 Tax=Streptomyces sp. NPDC101152 TaxID=3366116 RepID=UPI0038129300